MYNPLVGTIRKRQNNNNNNSNNNNVHSTVASKRAKYAIEPYQAPPVVRPIAPLSIRIPPVKIQNPNNNLNDEDTMAYVVNTGTSNWAISPGDTRFNEKVPLDLQPGYMPSPTYIQTPELPTPSPQSINMALVAQKEKPYAWASQQRTRRSRSRRSRRARSSRRSRRSRSSRRARRSRRSRSSRI